MMRGQSPCWHVSIGAAVVASVAALCCACALAPAPTPASLPTGTTAVAHRSGVIEGPTATATAPAVGMTDLQRLMLDAINRDRAQRSLSDLAWDDTAALAGGMHAQDMAQNGFVSHWNMAGYGPDYRYSQSGGRDAVRENVYAYRQTWSDGSAVSVADWHELILGAERSLMTSAGHQANILAPEHTHVGVGIAHNARTGEVYISQEFVDRYVSLDAMATSVSAGAAVTVSGKLLVGAMAPLLNVAYEPFPTPMSISELGRTESYRSAAVNIKAARPMTDATGQFSATLTAGDKGNGLYHVRVWVKVGGRDVLAADIVLSVG
jgi:uncharacterized protein YkwD